MPDYRVYFRGAAFIHGRHDFVAEDDVAATVMAELLYEACSDRCERFELWRGAAMMLSHCPGGSAAERNHG
jgi:hypothetical protein